MNNGLDWAQHINACDKINFLIESREEAIEKIDKERYSSYYQREVLLIGQLREVQEQLVYIVDHPLLVEIVNFINGLEDSSIQGMTIHYPLQPHCGFDSNLAHLNLFPYAK